MNYNADSSRKAIPLAILISCMAMVNYNYAQIPLDAGIYASYFGGSGGEYNSYIAVDNSGNVILAGHTYSSNIPVRSAYQSINKLGPCDAYIAKFNPEMTDLIFSTYLGGIKYDEIKDVALDNSGNIYVTGLTESEDFPITGNSYDTTNNGGGFDAFLTVFTPSGGLLYSTFIGGSGEDVGFNIYVLDSSRIFIAGSTYSENFPVVSAYSNTLKGEDDVFLLKFDLSSNSLQFSTFFGGSQTDNPKDLKVDNSGNIYICGYTGSGDFPVLNAANSVFAGNHDGFISKFNNIGQPIYSRLIGGTGFDGISGIDVNNEQEAYFIGSSNSSGLTCSANAFSGSKNGGYDAVIGSLNSTGDSILYFSYFGGNNIEGVYDFGGGNVYYMGKIKVLSDSNFVISGLTKSSDFPISSNAYDKQISDYDVFISVLNINEKEILYSTYFGGSSGEEMDDLWMKNDSTVFISGSSSSVNFPTTANAYRRYNQGEGDEIFMRFIFSNSGLSGIEEDNNSIPVRINLNQNYPNPFNPTTTIRYSLGKSASVKLTVFNMLGQSIKTLVDGRQNAGEHPAVWDATDEGNNPVSSGIYFYRLETDFNALQNKMVLLR